MVVMEFRSISELFAALSTSGLSGIVYFYIEFFELLIIMIILFTIVITALATRSTDDEKVYAYSS